MLILLPGVSGRENRFVHSTSEVTRGSSKTSTVGPGDSHLKLAEAIRNKTAKIGVIGLGYVGLPLVRTFVGAGLQTIGFNVDRSKVESLQAGKSYISTSRRSGSAVRRRGQVPSLPPTCGAWWRPTPC